MYLLPRMLFLLQFRGNKLLKEMSIGMAIEVFNRYENKFLINDAAFEQIHDELLHYMKPDEYNRKRDFYTISNIYFDTRDNTLIRKSMSRPRYKEKLRIRAYGVPEPDSDVYFEIKKKFCGLVNKRRTRLKLHEAYEFATGRKPEPREYMNRQVMDEIEYFLKIYDLEPRLYLAYDRKALFCGEHRSLRVTFDTNIRTRRDGLRLERGDYGEALLEKGQWLMEVKTQSSIPYWLSELLSRHGIYSTRFSKYGKEYQNLLKNNMNPEGENRLCLNRSLQQRKLIPQYQQQMLY